MISNRQRVSLNLLPSKITFVLEKTQIQSPRKRNTWRNILTKLYLFLGLLSPALCLGDFAIEKDLMLSNNDANMVDSRIYRHCAHRWPTAWWTWRHQTSFSSVIEFQIELQIILLCSQKRSSSRLANAFLRTRNGLVHFKQHILFSKDLSHYSCSPCWLISF